MAVSERIRARILAWLEERGLTKEAYAQAALAISLEDLVRELKRTRRRSSELHDHEHLGEDDL